VSVDLVVYVIRMQFEDDLPSKRQCIGDASIVFDYVDLVSEVPQFMRYVARMQNLVGPVLQLLGLAL
jgi:hypothetical protein